MTHTTVTAAEMKALEKAANDNGLLYIQMMENAGRAAFAQLRRRLPGPARLLVAAGRGNNGGDGFVMARVAAKQGWQVQVLLAEGEPENARRYHQFWIITRSAHRNSARCGICRPGGCGWWMRCTARASMHFAPGGPRSLRFNESAAPKRCTAAGGGPAQRQSTPIPAR